MARTGITREQVFEAANKLKADGASITMQRVRDALGETGSFSTISRLLEEWRAADTMRDRETLPEVPEVADRAMQGAVRELWRIAAAAAHREIAAAREEAERRIKEADLRYGEARAEVERLEKLAVATDDEVQTSRIRIGQLEKDLSATQAVEAELRERVAADETRSRELESKVGELGAAEAELRKQLATSEKGRHELDGKMRELMTQVEETRRRLRDEESAKAAAKTETAAAGAENVRLTTSALELEKRLAAAQAVEAEIRDRLKAEKERNGSLDTRVDELSKEFVRLAGAKKG
jgi:colicin import membrane protein